MLKPIRIVIADDNREYCELFATHCSKLENVEIAAIAFDGESAVRAIEKHQPTVVILDIIMSQLDGLGVMERVNGMKLKNKPKFIVVSALALDRVTQMAVDLGAEYYFVKPFDFSLIIQRILELCGSTQVLPDKRVRTIRSFDENNIRSESVEAMVTVAIQRIGIPPHIRGYQYVRDAILMVVHDMSLLKAVTTQLYPRIAAKYDTLPTRVERALRHAIEVAWTRGDMEAIQEYFGFTVNSEKGKPTNSEFIAMIADRIKICM
ncbi:MAG: sporulation transcription factor Spo0A [Bacillota bacterium]